MPFRSSLPFARQATLLLLALSTPGFAIDRIVFEADEITASGAKATDVSATLDLSNDTVPTLRVEAKRASVLRDVALNCTDLLVKEPLFACRAAHITIKQSPLGPVDAHAFATYHSVSSMLTFGVSQLSLAGGSAHLEGSLREKQWNVKSEAKDLQSKALRALIKPWFAVPDALAIDGTLGAQLQAGGQGDIIGFTGALTTNDFGFSNEEGTIVAEKVAATVHAKGVLNGKNLNVEANVLGTGGQALAGPVILDFGVNPLDLKVKGALKGQSVSISSLSIDQKQLLHARASGRLTLGDKPLLDQAHIDLDTVELPAAYTSFAQLTLATTDFGQLKTSGRASGALDIVSNKPTRIDLKLDAIQLNDVKGKFSMADVRGDLHWIDNATSQAPGSFLSWARGSAYGLSGGDARIDFRAQALDVVLTRESRLPIFDGAIVVKSLVMRQLGSANSELKFDAQIEPISMPLVSRAFGWPELQGSVAGRIPGLSYRNKELTVDGDISAAVFDGTIVGRNFRLRDPLGPWPRLFADVKARRLDLDLVTRAFPIGNITGRLDADINGLELFNWSPVAFDARLYTTPGDRSKHLISQKAITSISNVGGGGGGVTAALQSGLLRFFDQFRYDRIGLACRLENDVCTMGGVEPIGMGYYIVKGRGIPRIDIIGNQGRVDWPRLTSQIVAGMNTNNIVVK
jgi:hypothetical protein